MRTRKPPPSRVTTPEPLGLGVLIFGALAVVGAAGALVRYYALSRERARHAPETTVEIPAPELDPLPPSSGSALRPP